MTPDGSDEPVDDRSTQASRRRTSALVLVIATVLWGGLTLLVALDATQALDDAAKQLFRPDDVWSTPQHRAGEVIDGLKPLHAVALGGAVTLWLSLRRRSLAPLLLLGATVLVTGAATWIAKRALERPDTHGLGASSYPSGHVAVLLVVLGCLLLLTVRTRWWMWIGAGAVVGVMALSLLLQSTHWLADILGGGLLGLAVLAGASALTVGRHVAQRDSTEPASWP
ncbi:hypothetical protein FXB39_10935 [Nocardioides sp. BGMRC 2183]|nr:hypothetical protein FXB39_10935 [Nocardioides sp. BGMRC 2183]